MVDLRRVHVLRVVHQVGTITAAAGALHLTPSAVSQQLRQLARELDLALLEPDGRRVRLTPAAHALLRHADDLAARWERARGELGARGSTDGATVRIAGFPSSIDLLVVPAARRLSERVPRLDTRIRQLESGEAFDRLLVGDIDIAVTLPIRGGPPLRDARFEQQPLVDDPLDLLVPTDHPLAGRGAVGLEEAAHEDWVLAAAGTCDQHDMVAAACASAGFAPRVAHEVVDWPLVALLVGGGFGVSLKPRLVRTPAGLGVVAVPLRGPAAPHRRVLTCIRRGSGDQRHIALGLDALAAAAAATGPRPRVPAAG